MLPETIDDPLELLRSDRARAAELGDPHAPFATLATVVAGQPGARVVTVRRTGPEAHGSGGHPGLRQRTQPQGARPGARAPLRAALLLDFSSVRTRKRGRDMPHSWGASLVMSVAPRAILSEPGTTPPSMT